MSLLLMLILETLQGETILELEEIHISAYTYTNLVLKIVTVDYSVVVVGALSLRT